MPSDVWAGECVIWSLKPKFALARSSCLTKFGREEAGEEEYEREGDRMVKTKKKKRERCSIV
jgi:hypothetical protein